MTTRGIDSCRMPYRECPSGGMGSGRHAGLHGSSTSPHLHISSTASPSSSWAWNRLTGFIGLKALVMCADAAGRVARPGGSLWQRAFGCCMAAEPALGRGAGRANDRRQAQGGGVARGGGFMKATDVMGRCCGRAIRAAALTNRDGRGPRAAGPQADSGNYQASSRDPRACRAPARDQAADGMRGYSARRHGFVGASRNCPATRDPTSAGTIGSFPEGTMHLLTTGTGLLFIPQPRTAACSRRPFIIRRRFTGRHRAVRRAHRQLSPPTGRWRR